MISSPPLIVSSPQMRCASSPSLQHSRFSRARLLSFSAHPDASLNASIIEPYRGERRRGIRTLRVDRSPRQGRLSLTIRFACLALGRSRRGRVCFALSDSRGLKSGGEDPGMSLLSRGFGMSGWGLSWVLMLLALWRPGTACPEPCTCTGVRISCVDAERSIVAFPMLPSEAEMENITDM